MELELGQLVSHYRLVRKLGEGGMGSVFQATDTRLNRQVAIKVLRSVKLDDPRGRQRFLQEARSASALSHPNIVTIHDIFSEGGSDYLVMEYIAGKTLNELITPGGMKPAKMIDVAVQIADALATAHEAGIIHRDLKPGNIMVSDSGVVKLVDFGLAKSLLQDPSAESVTQTAAAAPLTVVGTVMGTAKYMSPEQAQGLAVDARSDVFTFGVVLYEMATGQSAFRAATTMSTLAAVMRDEPRPVSELANSIPAQLPALIERTMRKSPDDRPANMREVHRELVRLRAIGESGGWTPRTVGIADSATVTMVLPAGAAGQTAPAAAVRRVPLSKNKNLVVGVWAAVAVLAVVTAAVFVNSRRQPAEQAVAESAPQLLPQPAPAETAPPPETQVPPAPIPQQQPPAQAAAPVKPESRTSGGSRQSAKSGSKGVVSNLPAPAANEPPVPAPVSPMPATRVPDPAPVTETVGATPPPAESPKAVTVFAANLADGIPIRMTLDRDVPADIPAGEGLTFRASSDLMVGDLLVIRKGALARGVVAAAGEKKFLRDTKATMRFESIEAVDGQHVKIRESVGKDRKPRSLEPMSKDARSKDKSILAPKGTEFVGYVDGGAVVKAGKNGGK
jgi:serine/threonine-protein kinase